MIEGKIVGADEAGPRGEDRQLRLRHAHRRARGRRPLHARLKLNAPDLRFPYVLAVPNMAAQAREVVEAYGNDIGAHPVGSGPYRLGEYGAATGSCSSPTRTSGDDLRARGAHSRVVGGGGGRAEGAPLPLAGRVEINIMEEGQARWLAFLNRELDFLDILPIDSPSSGLGADDGNVKPGSRPGASCTTCCCART